MPYTIPNVLVTTDWVAQHATDTGVRVVEDDVLVGGNCGIYEGAIVKRRAVLAAGTILTRSTPIYDVPNGIVIEPRPNEPLVVPEGAVVVPGARPLTTGRGREWGLSVAAPVIVKYRDERTDARTALEIPKMKLRTSLTAPKEMLTEYMRIRNITARITKTPVPSATQPIIEVENLFVVIVFFSPRGTLMNMLKLTTISYEAAQRGA